MTAVGVLTIAALAVIGIGAVAVAYYGYQYLVAYSEQRAREKRYADQWQRLHADRRQVGE